MDCGYRRLGRVPVCGKAPSNFGRAKEVAPNHAVYVQHLFDWAALTPLAMEKLKLGPGVALPANGEVQLDASRKADGTHYREYRDLPHSCKQTSEAYP